MSKKFEVVLIATPGFGNLVPIVEFAQRLIDHDRRFSATILIITIPGRPLLDMYIQSRTTSSSNTNNIRSVHLPILDLPSSDHSQVSVALVSSLVEKQKPHVKQAITNLMATESNSNSDVPQLAGLFVDMFCTSIIDVANELDIPCYLYFASPATFLSFMLHLPVLETQLTTELAELDTELVIPGFINPVPPSVLPPVALERDGFACFLDHARRYTETKGIVINTLRELESYALDSFSTSQVSQIPPVYPIGPALDLAGSAQWHPDRAQHENIITWLEDQPPSSVVFLCFGSMGSLDGPQVREIANGLERARLRFLWSLREPPKAQIYLPNDYTSLEEVLPNGFLERTAGIGLVCGWVSQVSILAHKAIGGFVSHCGWNSILESLWHGVPIATWPIYAEQQMNAFKMVKELELAVEIRLDYRRGSAMVLAEEIERGIKCLMDGDGEVRNEVKEMSKKAKMAVMENGSSYKSLGTLIEELANKI
uniref:Glycosyltransferase n=1 Tax=Fagus sylvatica TaxID=28930 RepID=A0A2N9GTE2_FAGSY